MDERLQKIIAASGLCSRRAAEAYITAVTPQRSTRHRLSRTAFTVTAVFSGTLPSALPLAL